MSSPPDLDVSTVEWLCFGVGGANGWVFIGLMQAIEEELVRSALPPLVSQLKGASGASVGSIVSLAVVLGYTSSELTEFFKRCTAKYSAEFQKFNMLELRSLKGLVSTKPIGEAVRDLLAQKLGDHARDMTLSELHTVTRKHFVAATHNISLERGELLDHKSAPTLEVHKAIRMSCAIPGLFQPVEHNGCLYTDAALSNGLPFETIDLSKSIVFNVCGHHGYQTPDQMTLADYACRISHIYNAITSTKIDGVAAELRHRILHRDVPCLTGHVFKGFNLSDEDRQRLVQVGYVSGVELFHRRAMLVSRVALLYHSIRTSIGVSAQPDDNARESTLNSSRQKSGPPESQ